jgi:putative DNA primase/helicase
MSKLHPSTKPHNVTKLAKVVRPKKPEPSRTTDRANTDRLLKTHGKNIRYVPAEKSFRISDGSRWILDETRQVQKWGRKTLRLIYIEAANEPNDDRRRALSTWGISSEKGQRLNYMIEGVRDYTATAITDFDGNPDLLNCKNGTLNLTTAKLRKHERKDLITKIVNVEYDENAVCPMWLEHLEKVLPDPEVREFLQRSLGSSLFGRVTEEVLFFMYGFGANGKSVTLNTIQEILGDYSMTAASTLLSTPKTGNDDPAAVAGLRGSRFVTTIDRQDDGKRFSESQLKQIVSRDKLAGRFLYGQWFTFDPTHSIWMASNHKPLVKGTDEGLWRRLMLIPFTITIPEDERDGDLAEKLRAEYPGILRWLVKGCLAWQRGGLQPPNAVRAAVAEYRTEMDILGEFLEDHTVTDPTAFTASADIYECYKTWCLSKGLRPSAQVTLTRRLKERGFECKPSKNVRGVQGLKLRTIAMGLGLKPCGDSFDDEDDDES